jgi:hypothetical protein
MFFEPPGLTMLSSISLYSASSYSITFKIYMEFEKKKGFSCDKSLLDNIPFLKRKIFIAAQEASHEG